MSSWQTCYIRKRPRPGQRWKFQSKRLNEPGTGRPWGCPISGYPPGCPPRYWKSLTGSVENYGVNTQNKQQLLKKPGGPMLRCEKNNANAIIIMRNLKLKLVTC